MKHIILSLALIAAGSFPAGAYATSNSCALPASISVAQTATNDRDLTITHHKAEYSGQATAKIATHVEYDVEWPTDGGKEVVAAINNWICERLDDKLHLHAGDLKSYIQTGAQDALEGLKEMAIESELDFECTFESIISITHEFESPDYVTFSCTDYNYWGGAHGMTYVYYQTFRKSDGKLMDWSLLEGVDEAVVVEAIKAGLKEYFDADDEEEVISNLLIESDDYYNNFPLPVTPPYLTSTGVEVIYQLYEITPYVAGTPMATVRTMEEFKANPPQSLEPVLDTKAETISASGFPGGEEALMAHLAKNIKYPEAAAELGVEGTVALRIEVKADGSVGRVNVVRSLNPNQQPIPKAMYLSQNKGKTDADYRRYAAELEARNLAGEACNAEAVRVVRTLPLFETEGQSCWINFPVIFRLQ